MPEGSEDYTVTLNIITADGQSTISREIRSHCFDLSKSNILGIDLAPLSECTDLESLYLGGNQGKTPRWMCKHAEVYIHLGSQIKNSAP